MALITPPLLIRSSTVRGYIQTAPSRRLVDTGGEVAGDPLELLVGNERSHLRIRVEAGSKLDALGLVGDASDDCRRSPFSKRGFQAMLEMKSTCTRSAMPAF